MDRYFKLRQIYNDYLDTKPSDSQRLPKMPTAPIVYPKISTLTTPEEKARWSVKKITEEEAEVFHLPPQEHARPVFVKDCPFELRWYNKPDRFSHGFLTTDEQEANSKLAQRLLTLFLKTEMLELASFKYDDIRAIRIFFMDESEMCTDRLLTTLDNVLTVAMTKLGHFSDKISVTVDYELRSFMSDQKKAKRLVLETMLKYPEYIPDSWGGESAMLKWKEMKEADVRRREADAKDMAELIKKEKEEQSRKEEEKTRNDEEKLRREKEERIKKEVEEADRKKKEEKEKRRKEIKKEREEKTVGEGKKVSKKRKDDDDVSNLEGKVKKKEKEERKKKKRQKTIENTKTREEADHQQPQQPQQQQQQPSATSKDARVRGAEPPNGTPQKPSSNPRKPNSTPRKPSSAPRGAPVTPPSLSGTPNQLPSKTPPQKTVSNCGQVLSGRKRVSSADNVNGGSGTKAGGSVTKGGGNALDKTKGRTGKKANKK